MCERRIILLLDWQYSRSQRKHYVDNGDFYKERHLYEIVDLTPYRFTHQLNKEGYDLYHKGKKIGHGQTVKELKARVVEQVDTKNYPRTIQL